MTPRSKTLDVDQKIIEKHVWVVEQFITVPMELAKPNMLASSRVGRMHGVACSVYFKQPVKACLVLRTLQCFFHYIRSH